MNKYEFIFIYFIQIYGYVFAVLFGPSTHLQVEYSSSSCYLRIQLYMIYVLVYGHFPWCSKKMCLLDGRNAIYLILFDEFDDNPDIKTALLDRG